MPTTTTEDLDKELLGESEEEQQETSAPFSPPSSLGGGLPPLEPLNPFSRQTSQFQRPKPIGAQAQRGLPHFSSLESLYGHVQELGTDQARLRVERLEPQWAIDDEGKKVAVAGIIGYLEDTPSTQQFARRFGGRKYKVWAERQISDKNSGEPRAMDVAYAEFQVPLDPNLEELPIVGEDSQTVGSDGFMPFPDAPYRRYSSMNRRGVFFNQQQPGSSFRPDDAVNLIRTGAEMARNNGQAPVNDSSNSLQFLSGLTQAQQTQMREYAERQEAIYRDQIRERDRQLQELREEMRDLRNRPTSQGEVLGGVAQLVGALKGSTSEIEHSQLRASHEREVDRLNEQFQREKETLRREHERDVAVIRAEAKADKERWMEKERDLQREMDRRDQITRDEMDRREKAIKADAERELTMVRQMHESQLSSLRQSYEDKLLMTKMHAEGLGSQKETAMQMLVENLRRDLATIGADRDRLRDEADILRAKVNKSVEEAIDEAHRLAAKTGMISRDDAPSEGGSDVPKSRVDQIIDALAGAAMSNAPAILEGIGSIAGSIGKKDARGQQQAVRAQVQQVQHAEQQRPRFVDSGDEFVSMRQLQPAQQVMAAPPPPPQPPAAVALTQPAPPMHAPQVAPAAMAPTVPPPAVQEPWDGFEWTSLEPAQLQEIFGGIDASMQNGESPQACFDGMKAKYGETIELVGAFAPAERVVASIQRAPATRQSRLATKSGRRFIRQLWKLMAPPPPAPEGEG